MCWLDQDIDTCDDSIAGIDPGKDPVTNYMNFIGTCSEEHGYFTHGQIRRMVSLYDK